VIIDRQRFDNRVYGLTTSSPLINASHGVFLECDMDLYLQFGWGMMGLSRALVESWGGGTVILSPRDLDEQQLQRQATAINRLNNGRVMVDPQFYLPRADHFRLVTHSFWPSNYSTGSFFSGPALGQLISALKQLNQDLDTSMAILPGLLTERVNDDWLATQDAILDAARAADFERPLCATIALSDDACRSEAQITALLEHAERVRADAYYLVCEHPNGRYLVDDPSWLANVLDIVAGLKLNGAKLILGYSNHQMLIAAVAKADAIASGTWLNVRAFPPGKFQNQDEVKQKATWYYAPRALSEYKVPFLDIARQVGVLDLLQPLSGAEAAATALFAGGQPSAIGFKEPEAFRHYLTSLKRQVDDSVKGTFDETFEAHQGLLDIAASILATLRGQGISGQLRDFSDALPANRAALAATVATRGPILRREWGAL
jgi:hypothetical protein